MALTDWHAFENSVRWRLTTAGVEIEGSGAERSAGRPATVTRIWSGYRDQIQAAARHYRVPVELIIATIGTESGGNPDAVREEPGYVSDEQTPNKISAGLTQTLISTARDAMGMSFGRDWLLVPANAIKAGTAYVAQQSRLTSLDPPLVAAAYNAGRLKLQDGAQNRWKLRQYPIGTGAHCDRFVRFFNDAVAVLAANGDRPVVSLADLLDGRLAPRSSAPAPASAPAASSGTSSGTTSSGSGSSGSGPKVRWGENARPEVVPEYALGVLVDILRSARLSDALVTSTQRTPKDQARVMFDNCERHGAAKQQELYGPGGDQVIDVYSAGKRAGDPADLITAHMTEKIVDLGPQNVSRHTADPRKLTVLDVAPSSLSDRAAFEREVRADARVKTFLLPPKDPAYHLEIPMRA